MRFYSTIALILCVACEEPIPKAPGLLPPIDGSAGARAELSMSASAAGALGVLGILGVALDLGQTRVLSDREPSEAVSFEVPARIELLGGGEIFEAESIPPATYFAAALEPQADKTIALELELSLLGLTHTVRIDGLPPLELRCEEIAVDLPNASALRVDIELELDNIVGLLLDLLPGLLPSIPLSILTIDPESEPTLHGQLSSLFQEKWTARCSVGE